MQLVRARLIGVWPPVHVEIAGNDGLSVFIVFIGHFGVPVFSGRALALGVQVYLPEHLPFFPQGILDFLVAVRAVDRVVVFVQVFLLLQIPAADIAVFQLRVAQRLHDHSFVVFVIIPDQRYFFALYVLIVHLRPAVGGYHALSVRVEIALAEQPARIVAVYAFDRRVALFVRIRRAVRAVILRQDVVAFTGQVGIFHIGIAFRTRNQMEVLVVVGFLLAPAVPDLALHIGIAVFLAEIQGFFLIVKRGCQQITVFQIRVPDIRVSVRPGDRIAVGVQPHLLDRIKDAFVLDIRDFQRREQGIRAQQLTVRAVIRCLQQFAFFVFIGLAREAFGPDRQFALHVIIRLFQYLAAAVVRNAAFRPAIGGIDRRAFRVVKRRAHKAVARVLIADGSVAEIVRRADRAAVVDIYELLQLLLVVISLLRVQIGGYFRAARGGDQQQKKKNKQTRKTLVHGFPP